MVNISKNFLITMNSGDTFKVPLLINIGTKLNPKRYFLTENDEVWFAIEEPHQPFEFALLRKIFTVEDLDDEGRVLISLPSQETEHIVPGTYYMEAKIKLSNGNFSTILPKRKFIIL